jgi:phage tail sheath protein FI
MSKFLTPDVYTEEVPFLPQSVAQVSTAVPAFIGFTEKAMIDGESVKNRAVRVATLLEYKEAFGEAESASFDVVVNNDNVVTSVSVSALKNTLY